MNPNQPNPSAAAELDARLADYLAGELPPAEVAALQAAAAADPALARRLAELEAARDALSAGVPTAARAEALAAEVGDPYAAWEAARGGDASGARGGAGRERVVTPGWVQAARYAAVILVAFISGYAARDAAPRSVQPPGAVVRNAPPGVPLDAAAPPAVAAGIAKSYLEATRERPQARLFGRALLALARR